MATFCLGPRAARTFLAVQRCALPRAGAFTEEQTQASLGLVDLMLAQKPAGVRRKVRLFLGVVDGLSFLAGAGRFEDLGPSRQAQVLGLLFDCGVPIIRKGFWGLNTLVKLSVYGQPSVYPSIRYVRKAVTHG